MENFVWLPWVGLFIGLAARIFLPFLAARRKDPTLSWEWAYVWPQLLSFGLVVLVLPLVVENLKAINELSFQMAWLAGWGAADVGRQVVKAFEDEGEDAQPQV